MKILVLAFLGGIVGAVLMDITETVAARVGITSGVNVALVGRWFIGLTRGQLGHANILESKPLPGEVTMGWAFHLLVGGGGVALLYPVLFQCSGLAPPASHLLGGVLFGLATSLLPLVHPAAFLRLGLVRAARAARLQCLAGKHDLPHPLWPRGRRCDRGGLESLARPSPRSPLGGR